MALPPSTDVNESFLREVDDNLRRDSARDFFVENRTILIVAVLLFLVAAGGTIWYKERQQAQTGEQVEELAKIHRDIGAGNTNQAAALKPIEDSSTDSVAAAAAFTAAAVDLQTGKAAAAIAKYKALAANDDLAQPYRDIALIRQTALEFDTLKPDAVIARLKPFVKPGEPWNGSAGEMTALALIKQGKKDEAGRLFAALARDKTVAESVRIRATQIASSLGVDVSDIPMPASAQ